MRYPASEKLEIIRLVENPHQPVKKTLDQIGVSAYPPVIVTTSFVLNTAYSRRKPARNTA